MYHDPKTYQVSDYPELEIDELSDGRICLTYPDVDGDYSQHSVTEFTPELVHDITARIDVVRAIKNLKKACPTIKYVNVKVTYLEQ